MKQEYEETPFARAAQSFAAALPIRVDATDEDLAKIARARISSATPWTSRRSLKVA